MLSYGHRHVLCPQCGSSIRHRLIAAALELSSIQERLAIDRATVLHLSPEYCLGLVFRPRARCYLRGDFATAACDVRHDATRLPYVPGCRDILTACDMLEHIPDDRRALSEFHRVLRPGGMAILTVPQSDTAQATFEDPSIDTPDARARDYGQADHVRNYGADFGDRVGDAGFAVTSVDASAFDPTLVTRHVLRPPVPLQEPWGWNDRRIYFAERR